MTVNIHKSRLAAIRTLMKRKRVDALIVPSSDPHLGEYVPDHWRVIRWLTGFTGSAANVVITKSFAGLWTDSRYFIQAEDQLKGSGFTLVRLKVPHTPEFIGWLGENITEGGKVAVDGRLISAVQLRMLMGAVAPHNAKVSLTADLISPLWGERPPLPDSPAYELPAEFCGESRSDKINRVREGMTANRADYQLLTAADDVMWLLNIRGNDIRYSPLLLSFALVSIQQVLLFADEEKIPGSLRSSLDKDGVVLLPYDSITSVLSHLDDGSAIMLSPSTTSAALARAVPRRVRIIEDVTVATRLKAVKNSTELNNIRQVMVRDGVALTRFFHWLEESVGRNRVTELSASEMIESLRREQEGCMGPSFSTIAAYNEHAALPHYVPDDDTDAVLENTGIFLLDSGGQYYGGTTDITRTVALGRPGENTRRDFTLALKGTISLAMARFPYGTRGYQLDVLARKALWENGMNYGHGTGHGVGCFLNVHEGPQAIGTSAAGDLKTVLEPGMVLSDEPAFYRQGEYGFRTENLLVCTDDRETDYGRFLKFETVTLCYIDSTLTEVSLLDEGELTWLNEYHENVYKSLAHFLEPGIRVWLRKKTAPLVR